jgi:hypothetical protein
MNGTMKKNESIINPELYHKIKKEKSIIHKEIGVPQPFFKRIILTIKKFFVSLK